jgi:citrate synthase
MAIDGRLTVAEACERLGVKRETLYAYVSRGMILRHRAGDGRSSRFEIADVDRLVARRRRRAAVGAVEIPLRTSITRIADEGVWFRGRSLAALVGRSSFESVADLILTGALTADTTQWPRPTPVGPVELGRFATPTDRLISVALVCAAGDGERSDPSRTAAIARRLIVTFAETTPGSTRRPSGASVAARFAARVFPRPPTAAQVEVTDIALSIMVDHDLASSTLAARVAASTRADVYNSVVAGLATLSGPLHGSASALAYDVFHRAGEVGARLAVSEALVPANRIAGWGHRIYRETDPRATILLAALKRAGAPRDKMAVVEAVRRDAAARVPVHPNIDFALAAYLYAFGLSRDVGEHLMATARTAGWAGHTAEEYREASLRFRPRARYVEGGDFD